MIPTTYGDPQRWVVVWGAKLEREAYFSDRSLAAAYAAAHHGVVVALVPVSEWPAATNPATDGHLPL